MASRTRDILSALAAAIGAISTGDGSVTLDGRVHIGRPAKGGGPTPPCAWLAIGDLSTQPAPQLGGWRRDLSVDVLLFAPTETDSPEARQLAGCDLLDDLCVAVQADRSLGGLVLDLTIDASTFDGASAGMTGCAAVVAQIDLYWHARSAVGV